MEAKWKIFSRGKKRIEYTRKENRRERKKEISFCTVKINELTVIKDSSTIKKQDVQRNTHAK